MEATVWRGWRDATAPWGWKKGDMMLLGIDLPTATEWTAWWTFGLFIAGVVAASYAYRQLRESVRLRRNEYRAYVYIYADSIRVRSFIELLLVLENTGRTAATNVRAEFDPPLESIYDEPDKFQMSELPAWAGIPVLVPGQKLRYPWGLGPRAVDGTHPQHYEVTLRYESPATGQKDIVERHIIDLTVLEQAFVDFSDPDNRDIERQLRRIADALGPDRYRLISGTRPVVDDPNPD